MENIKCQIEKCVIPLNKVQSGLGDLVLNRLKERFKSNWLNIKMGNKDFSKQEYKLSTLIYYGTPMTGKYKKIYNQLIKN